VLEQFFSRSRWQAEVEGRGGNRKRKKQIAQKPVRNRSHPAVGGLGRRGQCPHGLPSLAIGRIVAGGKPAPRGVFELGGMKGIRWRGFLIVAGRAEDN